MKGSWIRSTSPPGFVLWLGILAVASVIALGPVRDARADYTPVRWGIVSLGPNPAIVWNQGTALSASDAVSAWNFWMGVSKLSEGSTGCGITKPCVVFANDGAVLSGTSCVRPSGVELGGGLGALRQPQEFLLRHPSWHHCISWN